jgi:transcriptional regulator with XRE-family HTH domain
VVAVDEEYLEAERLAAELLRKAREDRGLTQIAVADEMAERGFSWGQPTVARVENRRRHLSLSEARALMDILELDEAVAYRRLPEPRATQTTDDPT